MSATVMPRSAQSIWHWVRVWGPLVCLLLVTWSLGAAGVGAVRYLFLAGCVAVAFDLTRVDAATHMSACVVMFCVAPFLRRVVDLSAGYEPSGLMIAGPLLALGTPAFLVLRQAEQGRLGVPALRPFIIGCLVPLWGVLLTVLDGQYVQALSGGLKWIAPPFYALWLYGEARRSPALVDIVARTFLIVTPLMGIYGFIQYVDPPLWDRYWMTYTEIASIGYPEPFQVRVFSTLNAPAGYATFTAVGLLLFGFRRRSWTLLLAAAPSVLGLALSSYRTAWGALAVGILVGLFQAKSRRRAAILLIAVPVLVSGVVAFTPAGEALRERIASFESVTQDDSIQERLSEYGFLLNTAGGTLVGNGFPVSVDVRQAGTFALDGQFIVSWFGFGLVGGIIVTVAAVWAAVQGALGALRSNTLPGVAVAAIMAGMIIQIPLATISADELGFLFWSFAAIGAALANPIRRQPAAAAKSSALVLYRP